MNDTKAYDWTFFLGIITALAAVLTLVIWQLNLSLDARKELQTALGNQTPALEKANTAKDNLGKFAKELFELSKTNPNAKALVDKYQIHPNQQ